MTARSRSKARSRSTARSRKGEIAIDASRDRAVDRDLGRRRDRDQLHDPATARDRAVDREIAIFVAIVGLTVRFLLLSRARALSLSLSLFFRKCFEVKMRGENHFWVKGENIGQPEVIFRKISFSVTAKHADLGENDLLKSFSPKTNAPLG